MDRDKNTPKVLPVEEFGLVGKYQSQENKKARVVSGYFSLSPLFLGKEESRTLADVDLLDMSTDIDGSENGLYCMYGVGGVTGVLESSALSFYLNYYKLSEEGTREEKPTMIALIGNRDNSDHGFRYIGERITMLDIRTGKYSKKEPFVCRITKVQKPMKPLL